MENQGLTMKKDIEIPKAENIYVAAVKEWDKDFLEQSWNVYLINDREDTISLVLVMSRGNNDVQKTTTLRQNLGDIEPKTAKKIEFIATEVFSFTNEFLVTFFAENKLLERKFTFEPFSISEELVKTLPVLEAAGVLAK